MKDEVPPAWREEFLGGSPDAEQQRFRRFARTIRRVQEKARGKGTPHLRALHAKMLAGTHKAELEGRADLRGSYFAKGLPLHCTVRFSSASTRPQPDHVRDLRGVALRVQTDRGGCDLLLTNAEFSHIRDADEFMAFTSAMVHGRVLGSLLLLATRPLRAPRMVWIANKLAKRPQRSLAGDTFWSRAPFLLDGIPVRYHLEGESDPTLEGRGEHYLFHDLEAKLARRDLHYGLWAQPYVDETSTPLEDASKRWTSERRLVARLTLKQGTLSQEGSAEWREIDALRFDPWHTYPDMRPLGSLNRARRYVYKASQEERSRVVPRVTDWIERLTLPVIEVVFKVANQVCRWDRFGTRAGTLNLIGLRSTFRRENLYGAEDPGAARPLPPTPVRADCARTEDGRFNDLVQPDVGKTEARFGRNVRSDVLRTESDRELRTPAPSEVSKRLLARDTFLAASSVNLLAVAWVQFQVHDWFKHREVPLDKAPAGERTQLAAELGVAPTLQSDRGTPLDQKAVRCHENEVTHWWDCSQIYGDTANARSLRDGPEHAPRATLRLDHGLIPRNDDQKPITGKSQNWWIGLEVLHTLFAREHNAICRLLRTENPSWSEDRVYEVARLINVAAMAKIHTVEWTPAVFGHPTLRRAMRAHWDGLFGKRWQKSAPPTTELRNGIPGSPTDQFEVPFALTEEFVSVYRLHPMLPDQIALVTPTRDPRAASGEFGEALDFSQVAFGASTDLARTHGIEVLTYSLALACAGQMRLHNYPGFLRKLPPEEGRTRDIDLAAVEVFRDRERSVPRYNTFRTQFGLKRVRRFEDLQVDDATRATLREIYGDVDKIDLLVGLLSEHPPERFAISDTAFRVFVGMASRRLKSDRFLTGDFREELYTRAGLDWIQSSTFKAVLQRHLPALHNALAGVDEVFAPWTPSRPVAVPG